MKKFWHDIKILIVVTFLMVSSFRSALWIVRETQGFSSPSSEARPCVLGSGFFMSTVDLQRALNRLYPELKLKEDGVYGSLTKAAHERACGDQYAKELMVWEVK